MGQSGDELVEQLMRFRPEGLSANGWAISAGVSRTIWSDMRRHGNPSRRTLEKLLGAAGSSLAEFEALRFDPARAEAAKPSASIEDRYWGWKGAPLEPLPLLDCAEHGWWSDGPLLTWVIDPSQIVDRVARPPSLAGDGEAFAIRAVGDAMAPRFRTGRAIVVAPSLSIAEGEDVLVRLNAGDTRDAFIAVPGQLRRRSRGSVELYQPGSDAFGEVDRASIHSVMVIAGELF